MGAAPSTAPSTPQLYPSTASSCPEPSYLGLSHTPLQPNTLQDIQMPNGEPGHYSPTTLQELELDNCQAPSRKRKPGPKSRKGVSSPKKSRKSSKEEKQQLIQREIEELSALEKENQELANEEKELKQKLQDMQNTYLEFIRNKHIVYVGSDENPTSITSLPLSPVSSNDGGASPMRLPAPAAWAPTSRGTSLLPTPDTTPPSSPQDVVVNSTQAQTSCDVDPCLPDELFIPVPVIQHSTSNLPTEWAVLHSQEENVCSQDQPFVTSFTSDSGNSWQNYVPMVSTSFLSTSPQTQDLPSGDATIEIIDLNSISSFVVNNVL